MAISPEDRKYLEEMGELFVRRAVQMTDRFPFLFENSAREWLAEIDENSTADKGGAPDQGGGGTM